MAFIMNFHSSEFHHTVYVTTINLNMVLSKPRVLENVCVANVPLFSQLMGDLVSDGTRQH